MKYIMKGQLELIIFSWGLVLLLVDLVKKDFSDETLVIDGKLARIFVHVSI